MATVISKEEAYAHPADLLDRAMAGEEIVIEQGGRVTLKLVPVGAPVSDEGRREPGRYAGRIKEAAGVWDPLTDQELRDLGL